MLLQGVTIGVWEAGARLATKEMKVSSGWDAILIKDMSAASGNIKLQLQNANSVDVRPSANAVTSHISLGEERESQAIMAEPHDQLPVGD